MGKPGEKMQVVEQRVTTTARFFKNRLFNSGEAAVAPVLMTAAVEFPPEVVKSERSKFEMPGRNIVFITLGLIAGLASLLAFSVYRSTLSGQARALPKTDKLKGDFSKLQQDKRIETMVEKLQRMNDSFEPNKFDDDAKESSDIETQHE